MTKKRKTGTQPHVDDDVTERELALPPPALNADDQSDHPDTFPAYESQFLTEHAEVLRCTKCSPTPAINTLISNGVAGNPSQGGFRKTQMVCDPKKGGCGRCTQLSIVVGESQAIGEDIKSNYNLVLKQYKIKGLKLRQQMPSKSTERTPFEEPEGSDTETEAQYTPFINSKINESINEMQKTLSLQQIKINKIEEKNSQLEALLVKLNEYQLENNQLKAANAALEAEIRLLRNDKSRFNLEFPSIGNDPDEGPTGPLKFKVGSNMADSPGSLAAFPTETGNSQLPQPKVSFAAAVKRVNPKQTTQKKAKIPAKKLEGMFAGRPVPQGYSKGRIQIADPSMLSKTKDRHKVVKAAIEYLGIKKEVTVHSMVGKSIIEIYFPERHLETIKQKLLVKKCRLNTEFDPMAKPAFAANKDYTAQIVRRVTKLVSNDRLPQKLKEIALAGYSPEILAAIRTEMLKTHHDIHMSQTKTSNLGEPAQQASTGMIVDSDADAEAEGPMTHY